MHLTEKLSGSTVYTDVFGYHEKKAGNDSKWVHAHDNTSTYTYEYKGLEGERDLSARAAIDGYRVVSISDPVRSGNTYTVTVNLKYDPDGFDLNFTVKMDPNVPKELWPRAVNVRLAWFNYTSGQWEAVPELATGTKEVVLDENGTGTGTWHVWSKETEGEERDYIYRVMVDSFDLGETRGTLKANNSGFLNFSSAEGTYHPAGAYTAGLTITKPDPAGCP